ncbi:MAG TPA: hypothetical protein VMW27_26205, partial [Thermoanaerobaculia bacterium]|nr:hypothetical protein [Thermoanaerobaculia bacterium]
ALRDLIVSETTATDLTLVNLAEAGTRCTLALTTDAGESLGPVMTLTLRARESRPFPNVFERLAESYRGTGAQAAVSCDHDFYAYAQLADNATGTADLVTPEEAENALTLPAQEKVCPTGAVCFDAPGLVHVPELGEAVGRVDFPAPAGAMKRFRLSLEVTVGDWFPEEPNGKHLIYWFVVNRNFDMPGLFYFRGPNKNQAFARHGVGLTHPQKIKVIKPFTARVGRTYRVENDYDMARGTFKVTVTDLSTGEVKVTLSSRPNVRSYNVKPNSKFLVDMGFPPDVVETEVPSYGWRYSNVHVEAYPQ